jgi:hypothetical protein
MSPLGHSMACAGWSPLRSCRDWPGALRMGQWLHDADPSAGAAAKDDGAAHFYDRNAVERALPPVLHAAALDGRAMAEVYDWLPRSRRRARGGAGTLADRSRGAGSCRRRAGDGVVG